MIYKLYGLGTTGALLDGAASFDIQNDGLITAVLLGMTSSGMDALDDFARMEVSFMSSSTFTVNDVRGSIAQHTVTQEFLTTGGGMGSNSISVSGLAIPVEAGERVFLHLWGDTGVQVSGTVYLYVDDQVGDKLRPKRRLR